MTGASRPKRGSAEHPEDDDSSGVGVSRSGSEAASTGKPALESSFPFATCLAPGVGPQRLSGRGFRSPR
jgi:hypothetical protein